MDPYFLEWANLLLRWLHVIVAMAWIGSSFYFVFLDNNLVKPTSPDLLEKGVDGAMWAVHGGGFYNPQKYLIAPKKIHTELHWFYWESYATWLSGFALFTVLYLFNPKAFLIDPALMDWTPTAAIAAALGFLLGFWLIYDRICQWFGFRQHGEAIVGVLLLVVIVAASWLACRVFPGRAAFMLVGAMMATAMSANVFVWIIPGQRKVVAAMAPGEKPDWKALAIHGKRGKQRSVHNTYFTLPVIFAMLSNHYGFVYSHAHNWLILVGLMLAGALIRQFFVQRHAYRHGRASNPWPYAAAGVVLLVALIVGLRPTPVQVGAATTTPPVVSASAVQKIIADRCLSCHGAQVQMKNLRLDSPSALQTHAQAIYQQVVLTRQMPMSNATGMTQAERALIAEWFAAGAGDARGGVSK